MPAEIYIAGRPVGPGHPLFVMAEIGLNHNGDPALALALVDAAHRAGASAVKLQMFHADRLVAAAAPSPAHVKSDSLRELFALYELDLEACAAVVERARSHRLAVVVTAFDETMVDDLAAMGVDAFKIASGDVTHLALIEAAARTGRPLIISTGMSDADEVLRAVDCARGAGATAIAALHCVSAYPVPGAQQNLRGVATLAALLDVPVGLSDHGMGREAAIIARTLGASVYERHLALPGTGAIDEPVSSTPEELRDIVEAVRTCDLALGDGQRRPMPAEQPNVVPSRRGLYATRALRAGDTVTAADVIALRPATHLGAEHLHRLVGTRLRHDVAADAPFTADDLLSPRLVVATPAAVAAQADPSPRAAVVRLMPAARDAGEAHDLSVPGAGRR